MDPIAITVAIAAGLIGVMYLVAIWRRERRARQVLRARADWTIEQFAAALPVAESADLQIASVVRDVCAAIARVPAAKIRPSDRFDALREFGLGVLFDDLDVADVCRLILQKLGWRRRDIPKSVFRSEVRTVADLVAMCAALGVRHAEAS